MTTFGAQIFGGKARFTNGSGQPLSGGSASFTVAGTTAAATTWSDPNLSTANTNPLLLDGNGEATIFGLGPYQLTVFDATGAQVYSQEVLAQPPTLTVPDTGSVNALQLTIPGLITAPPAGYNPLTQLVGVTLLVSPAYTNTGPATISFSGGAPVQVVYPNGAQLSGGELVANASIPVLWNGTQLQLMNAQSPVNLFQAGMVMPFAGPNAPAGWALCYGQALSRSTYGALFSAIGVNWGSGDGSTTFNLPDLRGVVPAGVDSMGGTAANRLTSASMGNSSVLGLVGGSEQVQSHQHGLTVTDNGHTHQQTYTNQIGTYGGNLSSGTNTGSSTGGPGAYNTQSAKTGVTVTEAVYGSGGSLNVQPTACVNYIIYLGV